MVRVRILVLGIFLIGYLLAAQNGYCAIFKYLDSDGLVNFADDLQAVPLQYRSSAIIVSGGPEPGMVAAGNTVSTYSPPRVSQNATPKEQRESSTEEVPASTVDNGTFSRRATVSAIVVVTVMFVFTLMRVLDHDNKKSVAVFRLVLLWGMTVYLLYAHVGDVLRFVGLMGNSVKSTSTASEERGRKAATAIKSMQNFLEQIDREQAETSPEHESSERHSSR